MWTEHRPFQIVRETVVKGWITPSTPLADLRGGPAGVVRSNIAPFNRGAELRFPPLRPPRLWFSGDRRRGRSVENALPPCPVPGGDIRIAATAGTEHRPIQTSLVVADVRTIRRGVRTEHRPIQSGAELRFPPFDHRASVDFRGPAPWTKRGKRACRCALFGAGKAVRRDNIAPFVRRGGKKRRPSRNVRRGAHC